MASQSLETSGLRFGKGNKRIRGTYFYTQVRNFRTAKDLAVNLPSLTLRSLLNLNKYGSNRTVVSQIAKNLIMSIVRKLTLDSLCKVSHIPLGDHAPYHSFPVLVKCTR